MNTHTDDEFGGSWAFLTVGAWTALALYIGIWYGEAWGGAVVAVGYGCLLAAVLVGLLPALIRRRAGSPPPSR